jgi:hypothetical protein
MLTLTLIEEREVRNKMKQNILFCRLVFGFLTLPLAFGQVPTHGQTTSEKLMAGYAIPSSNTEAGRRILKDAPAEGPVF